MDSRDHARRSRRIVVSGPLAPFADGLRRDLAGQGYALDTVTDHVHLLADLSGWLASGGLTAVNLTGEAAEEFLGARRAAGQRTGVSARSLAPVLGYLRSVQAAPPQGQPVPGTPLEVLLGAYRQYLEGERGVSAGTVRGITCGMRGCFWPGFQSRSAGPWRGCRPARSPGMSWSRPGAGGTSHRTWCCCPRCDPCCATCTRQGMLHFRWPGRSRQGGAGDRACHAPRLLIICARCWQAATATAPVAAVITPSSWR